MTKLVLYRYNKEFVPKNDIILRSIICNPNFEEELTIEVVDI